MKVTTLLFANRKKHTKHYKFTVRLNYGSILAAIFPWLFIAMTFIPVSVYAADNTVTSGFTAIWASKPRTGSMQNTPINLSSVSGNSCPHENVQYNANQTNYSISAFCNGCDTSLGTVTMSATDCEYDGLEHAATYSGSFDGISNIPTLSYYYIDAKGAEQPLSEGTVPKTANTYRVYMSCIGNGNNISINKTYTITPKTVSIKDVSLQAKTYDGTNIIKIAGISLNGIVDGDNASIDTTSLTGTVSSPNVGSYDSVTISEALSLTGNDSSNYILSQPAGALPVNKADPYYKDINPAARVYISVSFTYRIGTTKITFDPAEYMPPDCGKIQISSIHNKSGIFDGNITIEHDKINNIVSFIPSSNNEQKDGSFILDISSLNYATSSVAINVSLTEDPVLTIKSISTGIPKDTTTTIKAVADSDASKYYLYYTTNQLTNITPESLASTGEGYMSNSSGEFKLKNLIPSTSYYVYVAAADKNGKIGNVSSAIFTTTEPQPKPSGNNSPAGTVSSSTTKPESNKPSQSSGNTGSTSTSNVYNPPGNEPQIKGINSKTGWQAISEELKKAKPGNTINIQMNKTRTIPGSVLKTIKGQNINIIFWFSQNSALTINGKDLSSLSFKSDYNMPFLHTISRMSYMLRSVMR